MADRIQTFAEFWPYYLSEHSRPACRGFHYVGTSLGLAQLVLAATSLQPWFVLSGLVCGYAFAWISHLFIEHNRPATFTYPGWSLYSDFRMLGLFVTGRLGSHLQAAGVSRAAA